MIEMKQPTLSQKVSAAFYVLSMRPELPGVKTVNTLMWPYRVPPLLPHELQENESADGPWVLEPGDVRRHAANLLASVHTALLEGGLPLRIEKLWTEQAEYLSSELEPALQDERIPSLHGRVLHPPENVAVWLQAFSGPYHLGLPGT